MILETGMKSMTDEYSMYHPGRRIAFLRGRIRELDTIKKFLENNPPNIEADSRSRSTWAGKLNTIVGQLRLYSAELSQFERRLDYEMGIISPPK